MNKDLCVECLKLKEAGRRTPPPQNLSPTPGKVSKRISFAMGSADEEYYICQTCGHLWLHETGNMGMGWIE